MTIWYETDHVLTPHPRKISNQGQEEGAVNHADHMPTPNTWPHLRSAKLQPSAEPVVNAKAG